MSWEHLGFLEMSQCLEDSSVSWGHLGIFEDISVFWGQLGNIFVS